MAIQPTDSERANLRRLLELARAEDLGPGDLTSTILPEGATGRGRFIAQQDLRVCGGVFLADIAAAYDGDIVTEVLAEEGAAATAGEVLARWSGPAGAILAAERVALNFLQRLSGVATTTAQYVQALAATDAKIYDTRKTTPGWRELEKYAVRAGGGCNHRRGLYDAVLVKDNHLALLARDGGDGLDLAGEQLARLRLNLPDGAFVELEVDTLGQLTQALHLDVDIILLDNMTASQLRQAVAHRDQAGLTGRVELEASGGVTLASVGEVASTGVERIAVGALTHSAPAVDISLALDVD